MYTRVSSHISLINNHANDISTPCPTRHTPAQHPTSIIHAAAINNDAPTEN